MSRPVDPDLIPTYALVIDGRTAAYGLTADAAEQRQRTDGGLVMHGRDTLDNTARQVVDGGALLDVVRHLEDAHGWEAFEGVYTLADAVEQHQHDHWHAQPGDLQHLDEHGPGTALPVVPQPAGDDFDAKLRAALDAPTITVTVTVPLHPQALADKCEAATVLGDVREALAAAGGRFDHTVTLIAVGHGRGSEDRASVRDVVREV